MIPARGKARLLDRIAAKQRPDPGYRFTVTLHESKFIPGRGWMQCVVPPQEREPGDPGYYPGCNDLPPDDSPLWEPVPGKADGSR